MKRSQLVALLVGGVFFAALMSLYHMLDLMQRMELEHKKGAHPGQMGKVRHSRLLFFFFPDLVVISK